MGPLYFVWGIASAGAAAVCPLSFFEVLWAPCPVFGGIASAGAAAVCRLSFVEVLETLCPLFGELFLLAPRPLVLCRLLEVMFVF